MLLNGNTENSLTNKIRYVLYNVNLDEYWENQFVKNKTVYYS